MTPDEIILDAERELNTIVAELTEYNSFPNQHPSEDHNLPHAIHYAELASFYLAKIREGMNGNPAR